MDQSRFSCLFARFDRRHPGGLSASLRALPRLQQAKEILLHRHIQVMPRFGG